MAFHHMPVEVLDSGSSVNLAGFTEVLLCGIVMGVVQTAIQGFMVAAWLQFETWYSMLYKEFITDCMKDDFVMNQALDGVGDADLRVPDVDL